MDTETVELWVQQVATRWDRPLSDFELTAWRELLTPEPTEQLDSEYVGEAILLAKSSPAFADVRPTLEQFVELYRRVEKANAPPALPADPELIDATPETTYSALDRCRAALANAAAARRGLDEASSKLLHEMTRADIDQGTFL